MYVFSRSVALISLLVSVQVAAQTGTPVLVVLALSDEAEKSKLEQDVITQLKLELDGLQIVQQDMSETDFADAPLNVKLSQIAQMTSHMDAVATTWIETIEPDTILLHMVALKTGRAYMRIIRAAWGPNTAEELAFSAQELLGQTYMMERPEDRVPLEKVVASVLEEAPQPAAIPAKFAISLQPFVFIQGANPKTWMEFGGGALVEFRFAKAFFLSLSLAGAGLPLADPADGWVSGAAFLPGVGLGYNWWAGRVGFGLTAMVQPAYYKLHIEITEGEKKEEGFLDWLLSTGVDFRVNVSQNLYLVLVPTIGFRFHTRDFRRLSDDTVIAANSLINWGARFGMQIEF